MPAVTLRHSWVDPFCTRKSNASAWATAIAALSADRSRNGKTRRSTGVFSTASRSPTSSSNCRRKNASTRSRFFDRESIADQLIELQTQVVQLRSSIGEAPADMLGNSPGFRTAFELLKQATDSKITVRTPGELPN